MGKLTSDARTKATTSAPRKCPRRSTQFVLKHTQARNARTIAQPQCFFSTLHLPRTEFRDPRLVKLKLAFA